MLFWVGDPPFLFQESQPVLEILSFSHCFSWDAQTLLSVPVFFSFFLFSSGLSNPVECSSFSHCELLAPSGLFALEFCLFQVFLGIPLCLSVRSSPFFCSLVQFQDPYWVSIFLMYSYSNYSPRRVLFVLESLEHHICRGYFSFVFVSPAHSFSFLFCVFLLVHCHRLIEIAWRVGVFPSDS